MITRFFVRLLFILTLCLPLAAMAQDTAVPDYKAWESSASAAEDVIANTEATNTTLEDLRDTLTQWRSQFLDAQNINAARIETLHSQIDALGDPPAEGETESDDISKRRAELNAQLDEAQAPVRSAQEAFSRANGLISEIDDILLSRQTDALLELGPSPLNPTLWPTAFKAVTASGVAAWQTVVDNATSETGQIGLRTNAALIVTFLLVALVLVARGPRWTVRFTEWMKQRVSGESGKGVASFVISFSQILVPFIGLFAITVAANASGLLGPRGVVLSTAVPQIGLAFLFWRWIAGRIFYATGAGDPIIDLGATRRVEATTMGTLAGIMSVLHGVIASIADIDGYDAGTRAVLNFPLVAIAAFALFRLARILTPVRHDASEEAASEPTAEQTFGQIILRTIARVVLFASVVALLLGAAGYMSASVGIVFPLLRSIGLLGFVAILSRLGYDLYALVMRREEGAKDALVPVLVSFVIVLLSLPFFALIWGMRVEQLFELWVRIEAGVSLGGVTISPASFITLIIVFVLGLAVTRLMKTALKTTILPRTKLDKGGQNAMVSGAGYVGVFLSAIIAIVAAGIDLSALAIVAGALSVGIGFGLQNIVQNFVSGIILLIERPISEGDWIDVGNGNMGFVRNISVRSTRVETFDKTDLIVPNADLISNQVTNYTRGNLIGRVIIPVGVAYGTDTRKVEAILREIAEAQPMVSMNPAPQVLFLNFGADALEFEIRAILKDVTAIVMVKNDINHAIAKRFGEEGIEIPFAQRDIWLRNPEALTPRSRAAEVTASEAEVEMVEPSDLDGAGEGDSE
ncbi:DUF3772 domain-containing protein [Celeribacter litoreus]|uniref:DUF3772 domain-containing protein n=1 Tax=Celeribacter litoreus TaxID=2876714 RepID=UPI001CCBE61B|nr:DUF3772 domain-containing protein [Celeribacter litoreus]MCA0044758.1 DUF3772 domain-containing protein [Celeribacter litoreus]